MTTADMKDIQEDGIFPFKVNGVEIQTTQLRVVALDILALAKDAGAMPGDPEEYILQGEKGQHGQEVWVDLLEDNEFITIRSTATQVA